MSQIYNKMRIDVKEEITDIITAKQDDSNSRFLDVYLYDGATPIDLTGEEVRIYMRKPDGTEIFNNGEITDAVNGRCQFELTSQALGAVGVLKCEISIWQGNTEILTTQTFYVFVTESLRSSGSIESSNEYGALVVLFQNLYQSIDLMQDMVANFGTPSGSVDADTFWQMLEKLYEVNSEALANASVSEVLERIGQNTDGAGSGTLFGAVNPLAGLITNLINDKKFIKSIQYGTFSAGKASYMASEFATGNDYTFYKDVTIGKIDITKSVAFASELGENNLICEFLSDTTLRIYTNGSDYTSSASHYAISWTVIEFA